MKLKEKNYLRKRKKKSESTGLTRQTWDLCHEIGRKKMKLEEKN